MPWKSDAQRRWGNSESGHKALGDKGVDEWNEASKGKKLPEKMAEGGIMSEPGLQDASVRDFLGPILAMLTGGASEAPEAGELTIEMKAAPEAMEDMTDVAIPSKDPSDPFGQDIRKMWGDVASQQSGTSPMATGHFTNPDNFTPPNNMFHEGGVVSNPQWERDNEEHVKKYAEGGTIGFPKREKSGPGLTKAPTKFDDGGVVDTDGTDWMQGAIEKAAQPVTAPVQPQQPDAGFMSQLQNGTVPGLQFNPKAGLPPAPAAVTNPAPPTAPMPTNGMSDPTQDYINQQKADLSKYGPDQQMALQQQLQQKYGGLAGAAPVAAGVLSDAIMQGVARAGNPGVAKQIQGQENEQINRQLGTLQTANSQQMAQTEAKMKLDAIDSHSELSKAKQEAYSPLLKKLGYSDKQISGLSASDIENATNLMAQFGGKQIEMMIKQFELGLKAQEVKETGRHNLAEEATSEEKTGTEAAKTLLEGSKVPGVPPSHATKLQAEKVLEKAAGVGGKAAPYGDTVQKDGKTYIWDDETGKYYLASQ